MHARSLITSAGAIAQHDPQLPWSLATPMRCAHCDHFVLASKLSGRPSAFGLNAGADVWSAAGPRKSWMNPPRDESASAPRVRWPLRESDGTRRLGDAFGDDRVGAGRSDDRDVFRDDRVFPGAGREIAESEEDDEEEDAAEDALTLPSAPSSRGPRRDSATATGFSVVVAPRSSSSAAASEVSCVTVPVTVASSDAGPATTDEKSDENSDRTHRRRSLGSSLSRPPAMRRRSRWLASSHPAGTCAVHVLVPSALMRLTNSGESASAFHSFLPTVVVRLQRASPPRKSEPYSARNTAAKTAKTMRLTPLNLPCDAPSPRSSSVVRSSGDRSPASIAI
mmetsp:Transcript_9392/g.36546  ORF Transcript_9392/g.36546 Transcript_9392/m.36546 type:complete len:337 (-) Transcript_9392:56-1066(-)